MEPRFVYLFIFCSLDNINVSRRDNGIEGNPNARVSNDSFEAIIARRGQNRNVRRFVPELSINFYLSRRRFDLSPSFLFCSKIGKSVEEEEPSFFFFFWPQIFSRLENEASTVTEIASVQILRTRHNRLAILYDIIGEKRMLLFRDRNQRAVSPSIAQRGIVDRLPRQQWNRAKRS